MTAKLGTGGLRRAVRKAALASGEAGVAERGDGFGETEFEGLGTLPATSMLGRRSGLRETSETEDQDEARGQTDVSEN